ncbi:hypothetical protein HJC23_001631 [Cyclotella cryptica]|uniref:Transmembrane protein 138 n=1 Tax=Cyclotella cryptica TaxID=29204 RepID=A0ABD3QKS4_9STRA
MIEDLPEEDSSLAKENPDDAPSLLGCNPLDESGLVYRNHLVPKCFMMERETVQRDWYCIKLGMMALLALGDLFLNSKAEYEALQVSPSLADLNEQLSDNSSGFERMRQLQITLFGTSILLQASIFSAFFLILVDTFPFQVGLLGVVCKEFKHMLFAQTGYSAVSVVVGTMRLNEVFKGNTDIWRSGLYIITSFFHKLVAPCYYAVSLRSALRLGDEKYTTKDAWMPHGYESYHEKD